MLVSEWLKHKPGKLVTVSADASKEELLAYLLAHPGVRDLYVVDADQKIMGHLSHAQIAHMFLAEHRPTHTRRQLMSRVADGCAAELMHIHFHCARANEALIDVLHRQLESGVEDMPVLDDDDEVLGSINLSTVLAEILEQGDLPSDPV